MANEQEVIITDAEFQTTGDDKIDFKQILFKQIDYIRFLRTQDMGEFSLFDMNTEVNNNNYGVWIRNSSVFQNAVKSLQNTLISYYDETYLKNIKEINKKYDLKINSKLEQINKRYSKVNKNMATIKQQYEKEILLIKRTYAILSIPNKYDELFQECILLMSRAKFIGGFDGVSEKG